jgi:predicted 3-demethylubiquinone-9 3-methyltransferase (glyoxalase superfamily)
MPRITPNLWFDGNGLEAAEFWCSIFPSSKVTAVTHYTDSAGDAAGQVLTVDFELDGQPFTALNGGPQFTFDEATSMLIECKDQDEIDYYWERLLEGGGQESQCGWLKDKFGFSWQVAPGGMNELLNDPDRERADRAMQSVMGMVKIDIAAIEAAADGVKS